MRPRIAIDDVFSGSVMKLSNALFSTGQNMPMSLTTGYGAALFVEPARLLSTARLSCFWVLSCFSCHTSVTKSGYRPTANPSRWKTRAALYFIFTWASVGLSAVYFVIFHSTDGKNHR